MFNPPPPHLDNIEVSGLISHTFSIYPFLMTRVRIFNHLDSIYLALDHPQVVEPSVVQGPKALPPVLLDDTKSTRLD